MEITFHGTSCVRLRGREAQVLVDPPTPLPAAFAKALPDIVVRTGGVVDPMALKRREGMPQEVAGPGEFEVRGVAIRGLASGETTIMRIEVDDVHVVAVGPLGRQLTEDEIDALGHVDVLVLPVGGGDSLDAMAATKLARAVEPAIVVPVRYRTSEDGSAYATVEGFAKEMGVTGDIVAAPKLNLTGSMPNAEETRVVVLEMRT